MSTLNKCPYFRDKLCTESCQAWNPAFGCQRLNNIDMEILSDNVSDLVDELRKFEVIDIVDDEPEPYERVRDIWQAQGSGTFPVWVSRSGMNRG